MPKKHRAPGWFELSTPDPDGAAPVPSAVFGWEASATQTAGADDWIATVRGHQISGTPRSTPNDPPQPSWVTYVTVRYVDLIAQPAGDAGGAVVVPPMPHGALSRLTAVSGPGAGALVAFQYEPP